MTSPDPPTPAPSSFTRSDLERVLAAAETIRDFEQRVTLLRFAEYTQQTAVTDERGRPVDPVTDPLAPTSSGYGRWRLGPNWARSLADPSDPHVVIEHYLADDRGPGSVTARVTMPVAFLVGEAQHDADYAQYLLLKARFDTDDTVTAAPDPAPDDADARAAATRLLDVLPPDQRVSVEEMLADRRVAARVYQTALMIADRYGTHSGDLSEAKRLRRGLHLAAIALDLKVGD